MELLQSDISSLNGVAVKRSALYHRMGVEKVIDLLHHYPRAYLDYSTPISLDSACCGEIVVLRGSVVEKMPEKYLRQGLVLYRLIAEDSLSGERFTVTIFNNVYAFRALKLEAEYYFCAKLGGDALRFDLNSPHILSVSEKKLIQPQYRLTSGLSNAMIITNMKEALTAFERESRETLPDELVSEHELMPLRQAISQLHFPDTMDSLAAARRRLAFEELLVLQLGMRVLKNRNLRASGCRMKQVDMSEFFAALPFAPTNAQKRAISELCPDMCGEFPMSRLLQGDVGSGKTIVAAAACYFAHRNGWQSAFMAPTELLAVQHYNTLSSLLGKLGVSVVLLTGSLGVKEKRAVRTTVKNGSASVVVGTHALFQKATEFARLGFVVTDEQHRFGVRQREMLADKGEAPHCLYMSATPIPRTLSMLIYGELEISTLDELPAGRRVIETYAVGEGMRLRAFGFVEKQLKAGRQAYIVCPAIDSDDEGVSAVTAYAEDIAGGAFKNYRIGILHGKLPATQKDAVMTSFREGGLDILVSTTVIEVGVDVPNANIILIENADRFGLSQLHQLRGRVGRGEHQSYCVLVSGSKSEDAVSRLRTISAEADGFRIAEEDLRLRGPGDFLGERQHGLPALKIAQLADMELFYETRDAVTKLLLSDPELEAPENLYLRTAAEDVIRQP